MSDTISVPDPGSNVESFDFNGAPVRVIAKSPDEPWFVASDVAKVLGYAVAKDMTRNLDDDEKDGQNVPTPGGTQAMTVISESGLYSAVLRSRVPQAKEFKRWVTREVLPSIRRHGTYMTGETIERVLQDPDTLIQLATQLKDERAAREASEKRAREIEELRAAEEPKRRFADAVASAKNSMLIGEFAKILRANGVPMGQQRLFQWLRDQGLLCRQRGGLWNTPTQRAMDLGLFDVKETVVQHASGDTTVRRTPKLTGRGQVYLAERLLPDGDVEVA